MPTPGRPSPSRSTRTAPARCCSSILEEVGTARGPSPSRSARSARPASRRSRSTPPASPPSRRSSTTSPRRADPDLVLDVRLVGVRPDDLDLDIDEIETALAGSFLKVRVRDVSHPGPDGGRPARRRTRSPGRSSATSRPASPSSRRPPRPTAPARPRPVPPRPRPPSCATPCGSGRLLLAGHEVSL